MVQHLCTSWLNADGLIPVGVFISDTDILSNR